MNAGNSENSNHGRTSNICFIIAACLFVLLAVFWSIDASFVYIFLGAGLLFLFLGFWNKPKSLREDSYTSDRPHTSSTFFSDLFSKKRYSPLADTRTFNSTTTKTIVPFVIFFSISFFLIIIVAVIFSDEDSVDSIDNQYFQKAENFRYSNQYDSSDYYYQKALAGDPENTEVLNGYGISLIDRNNFDAAEKIFERALTADPDYEYAYYNRALVYYYEKRYRDSLKELFHLMERNPSYYEAMVLTGDNYYVQQRYDSAQYWYANGYKNGQRSAWLCHVLGYLHDQKGDQEKAVDLYLEALRYDSTKIEIYNRLGELFPGEEGESYRMEASKLKNLGY